MSKTLYAIYNCDDNKIVANGLSREEQLSYIEYESSPGDTTILSGDDGRTWHFVEGGEVPHTVTS